MGNEMDKDDPEQKGRQLFREWFRYTKANPDNSALKEASIGCKSIFKGNAKAKKECIEGATKEKIGV